MIHQLIAAVDFSNNARATIRQKIKIPFYFTPNYRFHSICPTVLRPLTTVLPQLPYLLQSLRHHGGRAHDELARVLRRRVL